MRRAQTPVEFLILVGVVLFFFITFLFSIQISNADKIREQRDLILKDAAFTVQDEINLALEATDGYKRTFKLPLYILGKDYQINIVNRVVYARTDDGRHAISLPVANVTGDVREGENIISKVSGAVHIEQP